MKIKKVGLEALSSAEYTKEGDHYVGRIPNQVGEAEYKEVQRIFKLLGGKNFSKSRPVVFPVGVDPRSHIDIEKGVLNLPEDDYFPTPDAVIDFMVKRFPDTVTRVLEPEAGDGALCRAVKGSFPDSTIDVCEINETRAARLVEQGFNLIGSDFTKTEPPENKYDLIIMNPPFSRSQDIKHVELADKKWLAEGGTILAVMKDRNYGGNPGLPFKVTPIELPKKAFAKMGKGTSVSTVLVVVNDESKENGQIGLKKRKSETIVYDHPTVIIERIKKNTLVLLERMYGLADTIDDLQVESKKLQDGDLSVLEGFAVEGVNNSVHENRDNPGDKIEEVDISSNLSQLSLFQ